MKEIKWGCENLCFYPVLKSVLICTYCPICPDKEKQRIIKELNQNLLEDEKNEEQTK